MLSDCIGRINSKLIRDWQTYPILNIKPKLTEYFIHFIIH